MKREAGSGSIEVLPSGKARLVFMRAGKRRRKTFPNEAAAERALAALDALRAAGEIVAPVGETFAQLFARFMVARELARRVRGIPEERQLARARIQTAPFWDRPVKAIVRADVIEWLEQLLASRALQGGRRERQETSRSLSRETVGKALRLVRACFSWALERRDSPISVNPATGVRIPRHVHDEDVSDRWTFLTPAEIELLFASKLSERDRALFTLAIYAGPRQGEIFSLRWEDVHEAGDRPRVVFRRARSGPTKSGKAREVPLFAPARAALARWRELTRGRGLVFPNPDGEAYGRKYAAGWADKPQRRGKKGELVVTAGVKSRAGITRDVRFHDLRHTCASHLVMGTWGPAWSLEQVRVFMGHSTIRVTERYAHLSSDSIHAKAATMTVLPTVAHESQERLRLLRGPIADENKGIRDRWALQDLNLRLPPCESGSSFNDSASLSGFVGNRGQPLPTRFGEGLVATLACFDALELQLAAEVDA